VNVHSTVDCIKDEDAFRHRIIFWDKFVVGGATMN
jgi:hypothetical protein